ncbi:HMG box protein [Penicillium waksmanii]|uniref:HMG box protein n=1 Tax=Penicillium waksmanii TaxID=69791 RepID=UPI0025469A36|nr:HMG box protein [Penicillium waksmanii]KAJ5983808.1 HMG box protein [Penicillium waksmanii]
MPSQKLEGSALPPSPPTSLEGEFHSTYPPTYGLIDNSMEQFPMAAEFDPSTPPQMLYGSPPQYYSHIPTSHPIPIMPNNQAHTPHIMGADLPMRVQSASPPYSPSPSRKSSARSKARAIRSPKEKRGRSHRNTASGPKARIALPGPLSEITANFANVPVRDMEAHVNRPTPTRLEEARVRGLSGNKAVARPMNAFMLYRSAYTARCKEYLGMENHQEISRAIGASWRLESAHFKDQFNEWSRIERSNHAIAFPGYKFQPKKDTGVARRTEIELTPPRSSVSVAGTLGSPSDWDDLEPEFSLAPPHLHRRTQSYEISSRSSTPFDGYHHHPPILTSSYHPSWNTSFPSQSLPASLPTIHPGMLQDSSFDSDVKYDIHGLQDMPSGINGIPGGSHDDLCQTSQPPPIHLNNEHMDPLLLQYNQNHQGTYEHAAISPANIYGFEDASYISTSMPSGHSSPAAYIGESWEYMDNPAPLSF